LISPRSSLTRRVPRRRRRAPARSRIIAHVVDDPDKAAVEHRQRLVQDLLEHRRGDPPGRRASRSAAISCCCSAVIRSEGLDLRHAFFATTSQSPHDEVFF
jgi:hypothetical protein